MVKNLSAAQLMMVKTIVNAVKKNNIIWQTGSWQRSQSHFHHGAELAINGRVGK